MFSARANGGPPRKKGSSGKGGKINRAGMMSSLSSSQTVKVKDDRLHEMIKREAKGILNGSAGGKAKASN